LYNENLNINTIVHINNGGEVPIPVARLSASINASINSYSMQIVILNKIEVENNRAYVDSQIAEFKTLLQQRAQELGITYFV
jgi:hypothetical protein